MKHFYSLCTIAVMKKLFKFLTCTVLIAYALISCDKDDGIPPTAAFTALETEITEGQRIDFIDESLNIPAQWNWDFGDGGSSTSQHPSYGYSTPGIYSVTLTVSNASGSDTEKKVNYITVNKLDISIYFNPELTYNEVVDIDGNSYKTIGIGDQEWMAQNLATTHYNDGSAIPLETNNANWADLTTPAYGWYKELNGSTKSEYKDIYGAYYNWYAVETGKLCPSGWHVPSDEEWKQLEMYLGSSNQGGKLKETGTIHWKNPNMGATNEFGFTAMPAGFRYSVNGYYHPLGEMSFWWTSTKVSSYSAWFRLISYDNGDITRQSSYFQGGYCVRCIKDE
jgi:uncharacterized protein (TIGR02145 family)